MVGGPWQMFASQGKRSNQSYSIIIGLIFVDDSAVSIGD